MFIVVIMLERKIRHKDFQVLLARRVPEDVFLVYVLLLFFHKSKLLSDVHEGHFFIEQL